MPRAHPDRPAGRSNEADTPAARRNYESAVAAGFYGRDDGGLAGKFDNVRRYWEGQITRFTLADVLQGVVERKQAAGERLRVLDLGAGAGEGYEILTSLKRRDTPPGPEDVELVTPDLLEAYKGLDISTAMVEQGQETYAQVPNVDFARADLARGLGDVVRDEAYDVYMSCYGPLSHLTNAALERLLDDICRHAGSRFVFMADLVGHFSYEWQDSWSRPEAELRPYSMSYLYPREFWDEVDIERFPLRYWTGARFDAFIRDLVARRGGRVVDHRLVDRSVLVGRHMNTAEFNADVQPLRQAVNSLYELNVRTPLDSLIFDYRPHPAFPALNAFFERFQTAWNTVVEAAVEAIDRWDDRAWLETEADERLAPPVRDGVTAVRRAVLAADRLALDDPRANLVERQLANVLRNLEMALQQGLGAAHGLVAIYDVQRMH